MLSPRPARNVIIRAHGERHVKALTIPEKNTTPTQSVLGFSFCTLALLNTRVCIDREVTPAKDQLFGRVALMLALNRLTQSTCSPGECCHDCQVVPRI